VISGSFAGVERQKRPEMSGIVWFEGLQLFTLMRRYYMDVKSAINGSSRFSFIRFFFVMVLTLYVVNSYGVEVLTASEQQLKDATKLRREKRFSEAESELSKVIQSSPGTACALKAQSNIAMIKIEQKNIAQAKAETAKLLKDYSSQTEDIDDALNLVIREYQRGGYQQEVIDNCKYMIEHWPDSSRAMWAHSRQAQAYIELGNDVEAEKLIAAIKTKFTGQKYFAGVLCNDIANSYIAKGQTGKAVKLYSDVLGIKTDDPEVNALIIKKNLDLNNYVLAAQLTSGFSGKFSSNENYGKLLFGIAKQYRKSGKHDTAFGLYGEIVKNGPLDEISMRAQTEIITHRIGKLEFDNAEKDLAVLKDWYG
ncbi:MAG: hypothetical protein KAS23_14375, partial [Anaerohalosphaera sp.]|nr:hypothetical protein [Anaerohalosphaera sp.]